MLEHTYHRQIWENLFSISFNVSERWLCSSKSDTSPTAKISCFKTRSSLAFLDLELTHCITDDEEEHCWQRDSNCITNVLMNLRYIHKLVLLGLENTAMVRKMRCKYMCRKYRDVSIQSNYHCRFILQSVMVHIASVHSFLITWR